MIYENRQPAEGINTSSEHPLKEFAQLLLGVVVVIAVAIYSLNLLAGTLAGYIPFTFEQKMVAGFEFSELGDLLQDPPAEPSAEPLGEPLAEPAVKSGHQQEQESALENNEQPVAAADQAQIRSAGQMQAYLQQLADRLAPAMLLPAGMTITVHYHEADTVNAFATLGGNLVFFQGLIDKIESEDELAAVMAHEIAHIKYRHPIVALGKGLTLAALAAFVSGTSGSNAGEWLIGNSANLSLLKFSRDQERAADAAAAAALVSVYGHIGGADNLFRHFAELEGSGPDADETEAGQTASRQTATIELFRSHPYSENRWQELQQLAQQSNWQTSGALTPLPFRGDR